MALQDERPAVGVDHGVALAALDLLASVVAARATGFGRLDALAVDHRGGGAGLATRPFAVEHDEMVVDAFPDAARHASGRTSDRPSATAGSSPAASARECRRAARRRSR